MIATLGRRSMLLDRLAAIAAKRTLLILAIFSIGYLSLMSYFAPRRAMWIDEVLTFYESPLPCPEMKKALLTGADQHPPTFLALTNASMKLFGAGPLGLRAPAIVGVLLMELCVFWIVAK